MSLRSGNSLETEGGFQKLVQDILGFEGGKQPANSSACDLGQWIEMALGREEKRPFSALSDLRKRSDLAAEIQQGLDQLPDELREQLIAKACQLFSSKRKEK